MVLSVKDFMKKCGRGSSKSALKGSSPLKTFVLSPSRAPTTKVGDKGSVL